MHHRISPVKGWHPGIARELDSIPLRLNPDGILSKIPPHDRAQPTEPAIEQVAFCTGYPKGRAILISQCEGNRWKGHGQSSHYIQCRAKLGAFRFQKLEPCRGRKEYIAHFNPRSFRPSVRRNGPFAPTFNA